MGVLVFVKGEGAQAGEGGGVVEVAVANQADGVGSEQVAGEGRDAKARAGAAGFEEAKAGGDGEPGVVLARVVEVAGIGETTDLILAIGNNRPLALLTKNGIELQPVRVFNL